MLGGTAFDASPYHRFCDVPGTQIALLLKHGGLNLLMKDYKRTGIKGGVLRQYVQYDA